MTKQEFYEIAKKLQAIYTNQHFMEKQETMDVWYALFRGMPLNVMVMAVNAHVMESPYPPTPADINKQLNRFRKGNSDSLPSAEEAWAMVRKAVSRSNYYSESEFYKLPEIVQDAVGTHENLRAWAVMEIDEFETVQKSHFTRSYNGRVERAKSDERLPKSIRSVVEAARHNPEIVQYNRQRIESADKNREAVNKAWEYTTTPALKDTSDKDPNEFQRELMLRFGREEQGE